MLTGVPTVCRRRTDTVHVARLWTVIEHIRDTRQIANFERISRCLLRQHDVLERETAELLRFATKERLIQRYKSGSMRGSNAGLEQKGYRIPNLETDFVCIIFFNHFHCSKNIDSVMNAKQ